MLLNGDRFPEAETKQRYSPQRVCADQEQKREDASVLMSAFSVVR